MLIIFKKHTLQHPEIKYYIVIFVFVITSCGLINHHVYKLYPGPVRPDSEVATLQFGTGVFEVIIDGMKINRSDYREIKLQPGEHVMHWEATYMISVYIDADGFDQSSTTNTVQLEPGHTYTLHKDRTTGHGYEMYLWMTDDTTGEVVAGEKKP